MNLLNQKGLDCFKNGFMSEFPSQGSIIFFLAIIDN